LTIVGGTVVPDNITATLICYTPPGGDPSEHDGDVVIVDNSGDTGEGVVPSNEFPGITSFDENPSQAQTICITGNGFSVINPPTVGFAGSVEIVDSTKAILTLPSSTPAQNILVQSPSSTTTNRNIIIALSVVLSILIILFLINFYKTR